MIARLRLNDGLSARRFSYVRVGDVRVKSSGVIRRAKFNIGQVVRHRIFPFRGVVFDVDPVFSNTEDWWLSIPPDVRPSKDQPYYHLFAENEDTHYIAYVSQQNLVPDESGEPVNHPSLQTYFSGWENGSYTPFPRQAH
jgi:heat shock protein HspQ